MLQKKYTYITFLFLDDCTSTNITHFRELIGALSRLDEKIAWTTVGIRADLISKLSDEDIRLLWESGCRALDIGIESGSNRILQYINKGETKEIMLLANKKLAKYLIIIKYTFIIGYPTETREEINETIDFYLKLSNENPHSYPMIFVYTPIVGTQLYNDALMNKFKQPKTIQDWIDMDYKNWLYKYPSWIPNNEKRKLEVISISSLFCNKNAKYKLTTKLAKLIFTFYHPVAKFRFRYKFFGLPVESYLSKIFFK